MNDVFGELFKIPEREISGLKLYLSPHVPSVFRFESYRMFRELQRAKTKTSDAIRERKDGMPIQVSIKGLPLEIGDHIYLMIAYSFEGVIPEDDVQVTFL